MTRGALLLLLTCSCAAPLQMNVREIESPAPARSGMPRLTNGADGRTYLTWIERGPALRFSIWERDGWSKPRTIAEGKDWFVNWADTPSIAALADGTLAAQWLEKLGRGTYAYGSHVRCSRDGGATWGEPFWLHEDLSRTEHGFVTLLPWSRDRFAAVWLDGRAMESGGAMSLRARTFDAEGTLGPEQVIDERTCECCDTAAALTGDGRMVAAYRDLTGGDPEIRDISISRFDGRRWSDPRVLHADGWNMSGCPVNGPSLVARGDRVAVAWYTEADDKGKLYAALSRDGGVTFMEPILIDGAWPVGRVSMVMLDDGSLIVCWLGRRKLLAEVRIAQISPDGTVGTPVVVAEVPDSRSSGVPQVARVGERVVIAWTDPANPPRVRTAILE